MDKESPGLHLVSSPVENQLDEKLEVAADNGVIFKIYFKEPEYKKRI